MSVVFLNSIPDDPPVYQSFPYLGGSEVNLYGMGSLYLRREGQKIPRPANCWWGVETGEKLISYYMTQVPAATGRVLQTLAHYTPATMADVIISVEKRVLGLPQLKTEVPLYTFVLRTTRQGTAEWLCWFSISRAGWEIMTPKSIGTYGSNTLGLMAYNLGRLHVMHSPFPAPRLSTPVNLLKVLRALKRGEYNVPRGSDDDIIHDITRRVINERTPTFA